MKFWLYTRTMFSSTNCYRAISINTLHASRRPRIFFSSPYCTRRQLRLTPAEFTCKRSVLILYLPLFTRRARIILQLILLFRNVKFRCNYSFTNYRNSLYRICPSMGTNKILRGNRYYKSSLCYSLYWPLNCRVIMRRLRGR